MPKNGVIRVEPGAKLIVDGARITHNCSGFWYGIRVLGTGNGANQHPSTHGTAVFSNGAVIEHARFGVMNWDFQSVTTSGGIIQATDALFLNNQKSAEFCLFYNRDGNYNIRPDRSYFSRCLFEITDDYKGEELQYPFDCHASLWEVSGISFSGCQFYNRSTLSMKGKGHGLLSFNAGYTVGPYCGGIYSFDCTDMKRSVFKGFTYGIKADGDQTGTAHALTVDRCAFDSVTVGIFTPNFNHLSANRNIFHVGNGLPVEWTNCHQNMGIHTRYISQFRVEENEFKGFTHADQQADWENIGVIVEQSGTNDKELYKNSFENLTSGVMALGKNVSDPVFPSGASYGLRLFCNTFQQNKNDIHVLGNPAAPYYEGICQTQGATSLSAGNRFLSSGSGIVHINNSGRHIAYAYKGNHTEPLSGSRFGTILAANAHGCASRFSESVPSVLLDATATGLQEARFSGNMAAWNTALGEYENLLDGGDRQGLLSYISAAEPEDAAEVTNTLLGHAPWLSEPVLRAVIQADILPTVMLMDLLLANPDVLLDYELMAFLMELEGIGTEEAAELEAARGEVTVRTKTEATLSAYHAAAMEAAGRILISIKNDSLGNTAERLPLWLNHTGELWAQYELAFYYLASGDVNASDNVWQDILTGWELNEAQQAEYNAYLDYWNIRKALKESDRNIRQLTDSELAVLAGIREDLPNTQIGNIATSVLDFNLGTHVLVCAEQATPSYPHSRPGAPGSQTPPSRIRQIPPVIEAFPNPARDYVTFAYRLATVSGKLVLRVINQSGQSVAVLYPQDKEGRLHWDTRLMPPGQYLYQLSDDRGSKGSGKVVILK